MAALDPKSAIKDAESGAGEKHTIASPGQVVWMVRSGQRQGTGTMVLPAPQ
jgi:hypothetical protein